MVDAVDGEGQRVEVIAEPVSQFLVLFVVGVSDGFNEIVKPRDASTVFRRTGKPTIGADRILRARIKGELLLQDDCMLPAISKVIGVDELGASLPQYIRKSCHQSSESVVFYAVTGIGKLDIIRAAGAIIGRSS